MNVRINHHRWCWRSLWSAGGRPAPQTFHSAGAANTLQTGRNFEKDQWKVFFLKRKKKSAPLKKDAFSRTSQKYFFIKEQRMKLCSWRFYGAVEVRNYSRPEFPLMLWDKIGKWKYGFDLWRKIWNYYSKPDFPQKYHKERFFLRIPWVFWNELY